MNFAFVYLIWSDLLKTKAALKSRLDFCNPKKVRVPADAVFYEIIFVVIKQQ